MTLADVKSALRDAAHAETGTGVDVASVAAAEAQLGSFPSDYKEFLENFGWLSLGHREIFGLGDDVPPYLDVVRVTLSERSEPGEPIPATAVALMNDGAGNIFYFDCAAVATGDAPVLLWDHEGGSSQAPTVVAPSFSAWLLELVRGASS